MLLLVVDRAYLAECGVPSPRIVEPFDEQFRSVPLILVTPPPNDAAWPPARPSEAFDLYAAGVLAREEGRTTASLELFDRARNMDPFPWRATDDMVQEVRAWKGDERVMFLDAVQALRSASIDGIIGHHLIADNVHPTAPRGTRCWPGR